MKKKITFWGLLGNWFVVTLILGLINMFLMERAILFVSARVPFVAALHP